MEKMNFFFNNGGGGRRLVERWDEVRAPISDGGVEKSRNNSEEFNTSSNALVRSSAPIPTSHGYVLLEAPSSDSETLCRKTPRMG